MAATDLFYLSNGLKVFTMAHDGSSYFFVWLMDGNGDNVDLLANEIGDYSGSTAIITDADGAWSININ